MDHHIAIALLREAVAGKEDFVYQPQGVSGACIYVNPDTGQASCLVGVVIRMFNPEAQFPRNDVSIMAHRSRAVTDVDITDEALQVLYHAQLRQDDKAPWGEALKAAEQEYARIVADAAPEVQAYELAT
jgi:hypothetical protein